MELHTFPSTLKSEMAWEASFPKTDQQHPLVARTWLKQMSGGRLLQHTAVCLQLNIYPCWLQRQPYQFNHHPQDKPEQENNPIQSNQMTGPSSPSASLSDDGKHNWSRGRQGTGEDQKAITKSCSEAAVRQTMRVIIWRWASVRFWLRQRIMDYDFG